jgi:hypothetical protein
VATDQLPIRRGLGVFSSDDHQIGTVESWNLHPGTGRLASVAFTTRHLVHRRHLLADASSVESIEPTGIRLAESRADLGSLTN